MLNNLTFPSGRSITQVRKDARALNSHSTAHALDLCARDNGIDLPWHQALRHLVVNPNNHLLSHPMKRHSANLPGLTDLPRLELSPQRSVAVIIGQSGSGKSILATQLIGTALRQMPVTLVELASDFQGALETRSHIGQDGKLLKELARQKSAHPGKFTLVHASDTLNCAVESLLIIDEGSSFHTKASEEQKEAVSRHIRQGGLTAIFVQHENDLTNFFEPLIKSHLGCVALCGLAAVKQHVGEVPKELSEALQLRTEFNLLPWLIVSDDKSVGLGYAHYVD